MVSAVCLDLVETSGLVPLQDDMLAFGPFDEDKSGHVFIVEIAKHEVVVRECMNDKTTIVRA
ncbi:hypothetical protein [Paraburkholderia azotifigens]|uniref:Uncharacterized protein n=1 Tax=Paraburkholderia azotifigens TaxID=2057004 RepID=A0A5C6V6B6_9BURK|nr:hypothetical protein [Paraburkholderia azotifigens]TXC80121.1 hypothetical protein FRZ40_38090 [Paraburkholderia azotifigens]